MRFFDKYTGFFRRLKPLYALYNLANLGKLKSNKKIYQKYGLNRPVWFPLSSKDLKGLKPGADHSSESNDTFWNEKGFYKINELYPEEKIQEINRLINRAIEDKRVDFNYTRTKILFAYKEIPELREIIHDPRILKQVSSLMGDEVKDRRIYIEKHAHFVKNLDI